MLRVIRVPVIVIHAYKNISGMWLVESAVCHYCEDIAADEPPNEGIDEIQRLLVDSCQEVFFRDGGKREVVDKILRYFSSPLDLPKRLDEYTVKLPKINSVTASAMPDPIAAMIAARFRP